jgi:hypothetical protein
MAGAARIIARASVAGVTVGAIAIEGLCRAATVTIVAGLANPGTETVGMGKPAVMPTTAGVTVTAPPDTSIVGVERATVAAIVAGETVGPTNTTGVGTAVMTPSVAGATNAAA